MKVIGITGGVGCGKSTVLAHLKEVYGAYIVQADEVARTLQAPGQPVYAQMVSMFGRQAVLPDGQLDRAAIAQIVFQDAKRLAALNAVVHPAVKTAIMQEIASAKAAGVSFFFLEAALLIEDHYDAVCDELWYIYADTEVRRARLRASRGYSDKKISDMLASQRTKEEFMAHCQVMLDNSGAFSDTKIQIEEQMQRLYGGETCD